MTAKDLLLQQVKKNPKNPVEKAIMPAPSKMPNEMFLNLSTSTSEMSPWRVFTVKKESPTAKRMASAEITIPMQKMSTERIVRYKAGYFLVLKQQHILIIIIFIFLLLGFWGFGENDKSPRIGDDNR